MNTNYTPAVLEMFSAIAKTTSDNQKQDEIMSICSNLGLEVLNIKDAGIYVSNKDSQFDIDLLFVSHFDLVPTFERGFAKNKDFFVDDNGTVSGALDNTLTNAALLQAVIENGCLPKNVGILFTDGEESGLWGMKNFFKYLKGLSLFESFKENIFFVNLDVTNDQYDKDISIEYDCKTVLDEECKFLNELDVNLGIQHNRFLDDTTAILSAGCQGYSACIPTQNYCHIYDSSTTEMKVSEFTRFLIMRMNGGNFMKK